MKEIYKILAFSIFLLFVFSCKNAKKVDPVLIHGKWNAKSFYSKIEYQSQPEQVIDQDLSTEEIYFDFSPDGTYKTNGKVSLNALEKTENEVTDTYSVKKDELILHFVEAEYNFPITVAFKIKEVDDQLSLTVTKGELVNAFDKATGSLDFITKNLVKIYLNSTLKMDVQIELSR